MYARGFSSYSSFVVSKISAFTWTILLSSFLNSMAKKNPLYLVNVRWGLISLKQLFLDHTCKRLFSLFIFCCIEDKCLHFNNDVLGIFKVIVRCLSYGNRSYQQQWNRISNDNRNFVKQRSLKLKRDLSPWAAESLSDRLLQCLSYFNGFDVELK